MKTLIWFIVIFISIIIGVLTSLGFVKICELLSKPNIDIEKVQKLETCVTTDSIVLDRSFTPANFLLELYIQEVQYPDIVFRQACLESGFFKSPIWQENANPFGFKYKNRYLQFDNWQESIYYYRMWQDKWYINESEDYYKFLVRVGYASDDLYIKKLMSINLNNLK